MTPPQLAPELVLRIAEDKDLNIATLRSLCVLDKQTHALLTPQLYQVCTIKTIGNVSIFCSAVTGPRNLGGLVKFLSITCSDPDTTEWTNEHVSEFRLALQKLPNLLGLALSDDRGLPSVFDELNPPFRLTALWTINHHDPGFLSFLAGQSAITELKLHPTPQDEEQDLDSDEEMLTDGSDDHPGNGGPTDPSIYEKAKDTAFLPSITRLTADVATCRALAPGRPLTNVTIIQPMSTNCVPNSVVWEMMLALGKTSEPMESITYPSRFTWSKEMTGWDFVRRLGKAKVAATLKELVIHDSLENLMNMSSQIPFLTRCAKRLGRRFIALETFEVHVRDDRWLMGEPRMGDHIRDHFIGRMITLQVWQEYVPTLKKVVMYDRELH